MFPDCLSVSCDYGYLKNFKLLTFKFNIADFFFGKNNMQLLFLQNNSFYKAIKFTRIPQSMNIDLSLFLVVFHLKVNANSVLFFFGNSNAIEYGIQTIHSNVGETNLNLKLIPNTKLFFQYHVFCRYKRVPVLKVIAT